MNIRNPNVIRRSLSHYASALSCGSTVSDPPIERVATCAATEADNVRLNPSRRQATMSDGASNSGSPMRLLITFAVLAALAIIGVFMVLSTGHWGDTTLAFGRAPMQQRATVCVPTDSAWAIEVHVTDAVTGKPVASADMWLVGSSLGAAVSDTSGYACFRSLASAEDTVEVSRRGYRRQVVVARGSAGEVVRRDVRFERVAPPCCDVRGRWSITMRLETPNPYHTPTGRTVSGEVALGAQAVAPEPDDQLDSLVHVVRGLHQVDFTPFFGGPVAREVSTSIFGSGPDLLREVEASVMTADSVGITFIPRMSHGSLAFSGRIRGDTIRGKWVQNAYSRGARGDFTMHRTGPADTTPPAAVPVSGGRLSRRMTGTAPPATIPPGQIPSGRWRPELAIAPGGELWLANGGLFIADSLFGPWRRALGGETDPVAPDELRIGLAMGIIDRSTALIGLDFRWPVENAPVVYRTGNAGASWQSVPLRDMREVDAIAASGRSVWVVGTLTNRQGTGLARSDDAGKTWVETRLPTAIDNVTLLHRASASTAYLATSGDMTRTVFWRTTDDGATWMPVVTPSEQGLQRLESYASRVERIVTVGEWLIVREHGRVFASPAGEIRWRPLPGLRDIASGHGADMIFALTDSLHPLLLDRELRTVWKSARPLAIARLSDVEEILFHDGVGYVIEVKSTVHEVRRDAVRVVRPAERRP